MMRALCIAAMLVGVSIGPASAQQSKAAAYLMDQELKKACANGGRYAKGAAIERDLTGDGSVDLVIAHEMIVCKAPGPQRSRRCGMQVCTVLVYVREGALLKQKADFLGGGVTLGPTSVPVIAGYAHGGDAWSIRWDGRRFR